MEPEQQKSFDRRVYEALELIRDAAVQEAVGTGSMKANYVARVVSELQQLLLEGEEFSSNHRQFFPRLGPRPDQCSTCGRKL